jgi:hypothetical protein
MHKPGISVEKIADKLSPALVVRKVIVYYFVYCLASLTTDL